MAKHEIRRYETGQGTQGDGADDGTVNLAAVAAAVLGTAPHVAGMTQGNAGRIAAPDAPPVQQIMFIDGSVPDAQLLAAGLAPGVRAVILDPGADGVTQIAAYLILHHISDLRSVDIVAHGQDGQITLGTGVLSSATLAQYQAGLAAIGAALAPGGDIQIYGCDVAQDAAGVTFLDQLSAATGGAPIAAASHLVGAAADGGSWTLDVNVGNAAVTAPFTAATEAAFPGLLQTTTDQLFVAYVGSTDGTVGARLEQVGVNSSGAFVTGSTVDVLDQAHDTAIVQIQGVAIDAPLDKYFAVNDDDNTVNEIVTGTIGANTTPTVILDPGAESSNGNFNEIQDLALNQAAGRLYFTQDDFDSNGNNIPSGNGVYSISAGGGATTLVASGAFFPTSLALDPTNGIVFALDVGNQNDVNNLDYASLTPGGTMHVLNTQLPAALQTNLSSQTAIGGTDFETNELEGLAVNPTTQMLYFSVVDVVNSTSSTNVIDSVHYNVSGGVVTLGPVNTLYSGSGAGSAQGIALDTQDGIFYTDNAFTSENALTTTDAVEEGSLTANDTGSVATVLPYSAVAGAGKDSEGGNDAPVGLVFLSTPTVAAGGTVTYVQAGAAVAVDPTATLTNSDGQGLAGATVRIVNGTANDLLSVTAVGAIAATYNASTETLTLSGADTLAHYQTELDSVKFSTTGAVGSRTIDWTVTDGVITSATPASTVDDVARLTVIAGATATFTGGGAPVILDSGLTLADLAGSILSSATVVVGGFIGADTLTVGTPGVLSPSFSNGTLTLSGNASLATYQTALDSVKYLTTPSDGDPTGGGSHPSRTISWFVNDGTVSSPAATSTLDLAHVPGTIATSGTVTYTGTPVVLDSTISVTDTDSGGGVSSATVTISNFQSGDTLQFTNQSGITGSFSAGVETLTGATTLTNYQTALDSVKYATTSAVESTRNINWTFNDGAGSSNASTSSVDVICFCVGTMIGTPGGSVPVEKLRLGDPVLTAHNGPRPVRWIGRGKVLATRGQRSAATPVIVRKSALADNVPNQDLHVTKAHSLYIDDVLIPVEFLVNYKTILWDDRAGEVEIYHVELDSHDVLLANGAAAESFRDDGNRWLFQNAYSGWGLPPQEPYARVLTGGPVVDAVWRRLLDRAGPRDLPPVTDDPDLHLIVDGMRVEPLYRHASRYGFRLPCCPRSVVIASRTGVPAELGIARDPRPLGVALRQVTMQQGAKFMLFHADDERLTAGFHDYEPADRLRWTDGYGELPAAEFVRFDKGAEVTLQLAGATRYPRHDAHRTGREAA